MSRATLATGRVTRDGIDLRIIGHCRVHGDVVLSNPRPDLALMRYQGECSLCEPPASTVVSIRFLSPNEAVDRLVQSVVAYGTARTRGDAKDAYDRFLDELRPIKGALDYLLEWERKAELEEQEESL